MHSPVRDHQCLTRILLSGFSGTDSFLIDNFLKQSIHLFVSAFCYRSRFYFYQPICLSVYLSLYTIFVLIYHFCSVLFCSVLSFFLSVTVFCTNLSVLFQSINPFIYLSISLSTSFCINLGFSFLFFFSFFLSFFLYLFIYLFLLFC